MTPRQFAQPNQLAVEVVDNEIFIVEGGARSRKLAKTDVIRESVILHVDPRHVLRRTLQLPMSARLGLRKILENDLERQSPIEPRSVLFNFRLISTDRTAGRITISLVMVRRQQIDAWAARLCASGLQLKSIRAGNAPGQPTDDFLPANTGYFKLGYRERLLMALMVFLLFTFSADTYLRYERAQTQISELRAEEAHLTRPVAQADVIRRNIDAEEDFDNFFRIQRTQPSLGAILAEITERLPDGTWLYSLNYDGRQIEIQGYSTNASTLVANFDASKLFTNANFRAPMTQGPSPGLQQFDLAMSLTGNAK